MIRDIASILLVFNLFYSCNCGTLPKSQLAEQALIASLLSGYNKNIRPDDQVSVDISASLQQIVAMDEKQQVMTSSSFISQMWLDWRLSWIPDNSNNNITVVMLPAKSLWIPDTMILNSADPNGYLTVSDNSLASVAYTGLVYLNIPALAVKTRCELFVKKFPFDRQICTINLTSWSQGANRILYTEKDDLVIDIRHYSEHPTWKLNGTDMVIIRFEDRAVFEHTNNTVISIQLYLQRKPLYFMINGVFACLVLNCVTLLAYALPFGSQIGLCMTCFMTYSVYSLNFSNLFPQQSEYIMTITLYFMLSMVWTLLSMGWFVICNHYTTEAKMSKPLNTICEFLQRLFFCCFSRTKDDDDMPATVSATVCDTATPNKSDDQQSSQATPAQNRKCVSCQKLFSACFRSAKVQTVHDGEHTVLESVHTHRLNPDENEANNATVCIRTNEDTQEANPKCHFCDRCKSCFADYDKDKAKGKKKKEIELKCGALNYFVFLCILLFMFVANMVLWFSMAN